MARNPGASVKAIEILPHKVYFRATGETVDMTPTLKSQLGHRCAEAIIRWAKGEVEKELGIHSGPHIARPAAKDKAKRGPQQREGGEDGGSEADRTHRDTARPGL